MAGEWLFYVDIYKTLKLIIRMKFNNAMLHLLYIFGHAEYKKTLIFKNVI